MFKRPLFWVGLLLGGLTAFGARRIGCRAPVPSGSWLEWADDALVACDASGNLTRLNAAAQALFGPGGEGLAQLCYPTGQPVPPGRRPPASARDGHADRARYRFRDHVLEVSVRQTPGGGALAVFRDVTALENSLAHSTLAHRREEALSDFCRRLSAAGDADAVARAVVESARRLLGDLPDVQVRLYGYDAPAQSLTRLASDPEDHPKRPKSLAASRKAAFPFDAEIPLLWQLYVARQPCLDPPLALNSLPPLGEAPAASLYALPLLTGGLAQGHLSLASAAPGAFDDPDLQASLGILASTAAFALAVPSSASQARAANMQLDALGEFARAAAMPGKDVLEDVAVRLMQRVTGGICAVSVDPAEQDKAARKALRTGKTVQSAGILTVPLSARQGVIVVQGAEGRLLTASQIKFVETLAALLSASIPSASILPQASPTEGRADG